MKGQLVTATLGGLILMLSLGFPVWARSNTDEARLETVKQEIDQTAATTPQDTKIQALASQYNVAPGVVQDLHDKKQGWGGISIELAMAQRLTQTDPNAYPSMADALNKIETLRGQKMGWGKIAKSLGFKLGPVVSSAMHTRNELRRESQAQGASHAPKTQKTVGAEKTGRPEVMGRPEHLGRPERPVRPEQVH